MSKHRMQAGAGRPKVPTEAPEEVETADESADESAEETADGTAEQSDVDDATEASDVDESAEAPSVEDAADESDTVTRRRVNWRRMVAYGLLPAIALVLAMATGYFKWVQGSANDTDVTVADSPASEAMRAAKDSTIAMLSYQPETVEQQLGAAQNRLTGEFRQSYTSLVNDVVIPGAKEKAVTAVTTVPALAVVSADAKQAVVLAFVNQTVAVGQEPPTETASTVRVTLEKVDDRWLISTFDPV